MPTSTHPINDLLLLPEDCVFQSGGTSLFDEDGTAHLGYAMPTIPEGFMFHGDWAVDGPNRRLDWSDDGDFVYDEEEEDSQDMSWEYELDDDGYFGYAD